MPKNIRKSGWKANQSRNKLKKKTKLALWVLVFIAVLIIIGQIVNLTKILLSPWNLSKASKTYQLDSRFNINLVLKSKSIAVMSFDPSDKQITTITMPENTFMDVAGGFGKWQIRSVYNLGQSDNKGVQILKQTLSSFLGIPVDGFIEFTGDFAKESPVDLLKKFQQNLTSGVTDIKDIRTDLSLAELIRLKFDLSGVRFDKIKNLDLEKAAVLDEENLNDGSKVFTADPVKIDSVLNDLLDPQIQNEHMTIAVLNATDRPQLAQKAARLITNMGGNVIITSNAGRSYSGTQILGKKSKTLTRLTQIFDSGCSKDNKCDKICDINVQQSAANCIKDANVEDSRAQINIILGKDFYMNN